MHVKESLKKVATKVEGIVLETLIKEQETSSKISPLFKDLFDHLLTIASGGKGLRGALVYFTYKLFNQEEENEDIYKVSAAIEMIHLYLLIHDDIMDKSDTRHSKKTLHDIYSTTPTLSGKSREEWNHFGNSIAITAGDILSHMATKLVLQTSFEPKLIQGALELLQGHIVNTGYGQFLDLWGGFYDKVTEEDVLKIYRYKTGNYTFENPMMVGAILADASDKQIDELGEFAIPCGITYQIVDDILGIYGDEEALGKPVISDLKEGKRTILMVHAERTAEWEDRKTLHKLLGNQNVKDSDLEVAKTILTKCGSREYASQLARKYCDEAKKYLLQTYDNNHESVQFLVGLSDYIVERDR